LREENLVQHVLVYGDSLSWGIVPHTRKRLPFDERWPGVLENKLKELGYPLRIIEDCLNGRRTVWDDPFKPGRNGLAGLAQCIERNSPLALVMLMLGTNDFQFSHPYNNAWSAAQGVAALVREIRTAPIEPGVPVSPVLVISPPVITSPKGILAPKFFDAEKKCVGLADAYAAVCQELGCAMFDAGSVTASSRVDGIHLDSDQHQTLGRALVGAVVPMLAADAA
jgi:lysophospholipase L1-like esterase